MRKLFRILKNTVLFLLLQAVVAISLGIGLVFYGPFENLKELWVTTAMTTYSHQYLATLFLNKDEVNRIMEKNKIQQPKENSDESAITVGTNMDNKQPEDDIKIKDEVKFIDISNENYKGYVLEITNPKRVFMGTTNSVGNMGLKLTDMVKRYDALGGINAGGFEDDGGHGNGGIPLGVLISQGKVIYGNEKETYGVIGFKDDNVMFLGNYTLQELREKKVRDAASFGPFLIVNGEPMIKSGNGGMGLQPRTAIGQKQDGTIVMLVIDGRQVGSIGATLKDVQDILIERGVYNAANLDGGSSTTMVYNDKLVNKPCSPYGPRYLPSAFLIKKDLTENIVPNINKNVQNDNTTEN